MIAWMHVPKLSCMTDYNIYFLLTSGHKTSLQGIFNFAVLGKSFQIYHNLVNLKYNKVCMVIGIIILQMHAPMPIAIVEQFESKYRSWMTKWPRLFRQWTFL